jgi:C-terminal processing protease CtpA/Prc
VDGDLGSLILNRFDVILDYRHERMFLAPNHSWPKPHEADMAGLVLEQDRDGFYEIGYVIENSPAAERDPRKGDKIVRLNGKDVREYTYGEAFDLLRQDGRNLNIAVARGNRLFEATITLRRLI